MAIFSFRAECFHDVQEALAHVRDFPVSEMRIIFPDGFLDTKVELTADTDLETVMAALRAVPDGHVMVQTVRQCPLSENSFERDWRRQ